VSAPGGSSLATGFGAGPGAALHPVDLAGRDAAVDREVLAALVGLHLRDRARAEDAVGVRVELELREQLLQLTDVVAAVSTFQRAFAELRGACRGDGDGGRQDGDQRDGSGQGCAHARTSSRSRWGACRRHARTPARQLRGGAADTRHPTRGAHGIDLAGGTSPRAGPAAGARRVV